MASAKKPPSAQSVAEQLRSAVKKTFEATVGDGGFNRDRAQEIMDEVTEAADRWGRGAVDELRQLAGQELSSTRKRIETLEKRLADLEGRVRPSKPGAKSGAKAAAKPAARATGSVTKPKPAAKAKPVAKKPAAKPKPAPKAPAAKAASRSKATAKPRTAAKPAPKTSR